MLPKKGKIWVKSWFESLFFHLFMMPNRSVNKLLKIWNFRKVYVSTAANEQLYWLNFAIWLLGNIPPLFYCSLRMSWLTDQAREYLQYGKIAWADWIQNFEHDFHISEERRCSLIRHHRLHVPQRRASASKASESWGYPFLKANPKCCFVAPTTLICGSLNNGRGKVCDKSCFYDTPMMLPTIFCLFIRFLNINVIQLLFVRLNYVRGKGSRQKLFLRYVHVAHDILSLFSRVVKRVKI